MFATDTHADQPKIAIIEQHPDIIPLEDRFLDMLERLSQQYPSRWYPVISQLGQGQALAERILKLHPDRRPKFR